MIVVADAGPLVALADIGRLDLLGQVVGDVHVPPAVEREVFVTRTRPRPPWLRVATPTGPPPQSLADAKLGRGETEALTLAVERSARLVLVDDRRARRTARALGLPIGGTLAVLVEAKRAGFLPSVKPELERLVLTGFRVSTRLRRLTLSRAGE